MPGDFPYIVNCVGLFVSLRRRLPVLGLALTLGIPASAEELQFQPSAALSSAMLGIGPEVGVRLTGKLGARIDATVTRLAEALRVENVGDGGRLRLRSGGAMFDLHPFGDGFRLSAGTRFGSLRSALAAAPSGPVTIGSRSVTPAQVGRMLGKVHVRKFAPALTLGYGGAVASAMTLGVEAGALFQGAPRIREFGSEGGSLSAEAGFASDLERERIRVENDLDGYRLYPVVRMSLGYRF